jgi:hypothetical protein
MREITDKDIFEWLEKECNKNNLLNFQPSWKNENIIDAYFKNSDEHFAIFYKDKIRELIYDTKEEKE